MTAGSRPRGLVGPRGEGREQVVAAALDLLDEAGLDGLTMRALADRMGVRAAALYWHVRDKEQLLGLLAEAILAEVGEPAGDLPWRAQLETFAADYRRVLQSHRDAARIVLAVQPTAPRVYERLVRPLVASGFDGPVAIEVCQLLTGTYVPAAVAGEVRAAGATAAESEELGAPLGDLDRGRLFITGGSAAMTLRADPTLADLYSGRFQGRPPTVRVQDGTVRIAMRYPALQFRRQSADVALNAAVEWEVDIADGAWRLNADLRGLRGLRSFNVSAGAADVTLLLPPPRGLATVRISGGAHKLSIHRPPGTAARVRVEQGASRLTLDTMKLGSVGGETLWETPDFGAAPDRYDVEILGGANRVTFDSAQPESAEPAEPAVVRIAPGGQVEPLSPEEFPTLAPLAGHLAHPDPDARFEFGLRVLLDGVERALARG